MSTSTIPAYHEVVGALHLHTSFSDGGTTYEELIDAAESVGLDYIGVTDHMSLVARNKGFEGFSQGVMVLIGYEHHDENTQNHYLAFNAQTIAPAALKPQEYIDAINAQGGFGFLAHPMEKRDYFKNLPPYPWTDWSATGFAGIELWNQMSDWMENLKSWFSIIRLFFPRRFMRNAPHALLKKWDELNQKRFVAAIGGVDAHSHRLDWGLISFTLFPIKVELKGIRTHLYCSKPLDTNDTDGSRKTILDALKNGQGFIANYRRGDARGSRIFLVDSEGKEYPPGSGATLAVKPATIRVDLPLSARLKCICNGAVMQELQAAKAEFTLSRPGVWRIEAYRERRAWIYSNPFIIK